LESYELSEGRLAGAPTIVFCVDRHNLPHVAVTITSIVENVSRGPALEIFVLFDGKASSLTSRFRNKRWHPHQVHLRFCEQPFTDIVPFDHVSTAALLRLNIHGLVPQANRVIYLDADTVVLGDIRELFESDLCGNAAGGVLDFGMYSTRRYRNFVEGSDDLDTYFRLQLGLELEDITYINSGVLLLDLQRLREMKFFERASAMLARQADRLWWRDQDVINVLLDGQIELLDPKWNCLQWSLFKGPENLYFAETHTAAVRRQINSPAILHFISRYKPWTGSHRYPTTSAWWKYAYSTSPAWRFLRVSALVSEFLFTPYWAARSWLRSQLLKRRALRFATHKILRLFGRGGSFK
jgi:lipopolysaccharide biosynthesis glycosyltransferase